MNFYFLAAGCFATSQSKQIFDLLNGHLIEKIKGLLGLIIKTLIVVFVNRVLIMRLVK